MYSNPDCPILYITHAFCFNSQEFVFLTTFGAGIMGFYRVDRTNGQVYTETTMAPALALSRGTSWVHESPYLPLGWEDTNEIGSASLKHSAMKRILSDQRALTPEIFATVPWHIANYLWDCLGRR